MRRFIQTNLFLLTLSLMSPALAAPGDLDLTFNGTGKVVTSVNGRNPFTAKVLPLPDGKILVAGTSRDLEGISSSGFFLCRYLANGSPDSSFNGTGMVTTPFAGDAWSVHCIDMVLQNDGKILLGGSASSGVSMDNVLVRYNANGSLDTGFGTSGIVLTDIKARLSGGTGSSTDQGGALAVQSDGKILLGGWTDVAQSYGHPQVGALIRYKTDGTVDTSFGTNGVVVDETFFTTVSFWSGMVLQNDGKIVLCGATAANGSVNGFAVVRLKADGNFDASFSGDGITTIFFPTDKPVECNGIALQSDGKIVVVGNEDLWGAPGDVAVARLTSSGALDTSFSGDGKVLTNVGGTDSMSYGTDVVIQKDGKILVCGFYWASERQDSDIHVLRYTTNGSLDTSFSGDGKALVNIDTETTSQMGTTDFAFSIALQPDGMILTVGDLYLIDLTSAIALARFQSANPLSPPVTTAPGTKTSPGPSLTTLTPTFTWSAVTGAAGYALSITDLVSGDEVYSKSDIGAVTSHLLPEGMLRNKGRYSWTMRTRNGGGSSASSATMYFTIAENTPVPTTPILTSPGSLVISGKLSTGTAPAFTWKAISGVNGHEIVIIDEFTNISVFSSDTIGAANTFTPAAGTLQPGASYRWAVRAKNGSGWGLWSAFFHFQTPGTGLAPAAPVTVTPGATTSPGTLLTTLTLTPLLKWNSVPGATGYDVSVRDDRGAPVVTPAGVVTATEYLVPPGLLQPGRSYWWNVRTRTAVGISNFSLNRFFQTTPVYAAPAITAINPTTVVGSDITQTIKILGSGFRQGAQVFVSYTGKPDLLVAAANTKFINDTQMTINVVTKKVSDTWTVKVKNSDGLVSVPVAFQVVAPSVTPLLPPALAANAVTLPGSSYVFTQPVFLDLAHGNASSAEIRYTLDGTTPDRNSLLYDGTPILLGAKSPTVIKTICVNTTDPASSVRSCSLTFNLPTITVPTSGTVYGPAMTAAQGTLYYLKLVVPAGISKFTLASDGVNGTYRFYLAKDRLPAATEYDRASVSYWAAGPAFEVLGDLSGDAGTYFILIKPTDANASRGKLSATATRQITPPAKPTITPNPGNHIGPLLVTLKPNTPNSTIYYTVDGTAPQPSQPWLSTTQTYTGPFNLITNAKVRAVAANADGKSAESVADFIVKPGEGMKLEWSEDTSFNATQFVRPQIAEVTIPVSWATTNVVEQTFSFDVPADPLPNASYPSLTYSVAMVSDLISSHGGAVSVYLKAGGPSPAAKTDIDVAQLPSLDSITTARRVLGPSGPLRPLGPLGPILWKTGKDLIPGTTYYVLLRIEGFRPPPGLAGGAYWSPDVTVQLKFTRHSARLSSIAGVQPGLDNTWLVIHGRDNTSETPRVADQVSALHQASGGPYVGQVLSLNWGTMAKPSWSGSTDESIYTQPVGKRTSEVLSSFGFTPSMLSLTGHSWGTHVAYSLAKEGYAKAADKSKGKVKRLVACDPAQFYWNESPNFAAYASTSWSFVSRYSLFGSEGLASTATEAFLLDVGYYRNLIEVDGFPLKTNVDVHAAPFELFTHFLRCNYDPTYADSKFTDPTLSIYFALYWLDHQNISQFRPNRWPLGSLPWNFEAQIDGSIDTEGLDETQPLTLKYTTSGSGSGTNMTVPSP